MKMKKPFIALSILVVIIISLSSVAFAAGVVKTPAEIVAGLTDRTVDEVTAARQNGTSYGAQAAAADQLEAFQDQRLEQYKTTLDEAVTNQELTQAEADTLYNNMKDRIESCTGTGTGTGSGFRNGTGNCGGSGTCGMGQGYATGTGRGGRGFGMMGRS
jgi:hypothetical protein